MMGFFDKLSIPMVCYIFLLSAISAAVIQTCMVSGRSPTFLPE